MWRHGGIAVASALAALSPSKGGHGHANAAEVRTHLSVTATVIERVSLHMTHQARELNVTAEDIARGYVEVRNASRSKCRRRASVCWNSNLPDDWSHRFA